MLKKISPCAIFCVALTLCATTHAADGDFAWARSMGGGSNPEIGYSVAVDAAGNVYTTGYFQDATDFDPGAGTFVLTPVGNTDVFVSKLDINGNFLWAKALGGPSFEEGNSIKLDASGNVYTTGFFQNVVDFDPGPGTYNLDGSGGFNYLFISKLDTDGNFLWAKSIGGAFHAIGESVAVDAAGNVITTGLFSDVVDFNPFDDGDPLTTGDVFNLISLNGNYETFVLKLDSDGNFVWAMSLGGASSNDIGRSVAVDASGNVYTTGYFNGAADFDPSAGDFILTPVGADDIFVSKLDAGGGFVWAKALGGTGIDKGYSVAVDVSGNAYITGYFGDTVDFDPGAGVYNLTSAGLEDIFVSKLDTNGNFVWANAMGGTSYEYGYSVAVDASGNAYTTGFFRGGVDFDPGAGTASFGSLGQDDIFVSKMDTNGIFVWAKTIGDSLSDVGYSVAVDASGNVHVTGNFNGTVDFLSGVGVFYLTATGFIGDVFVLKLEGQSIPHNADGDGDGVISLSELLRLIQFFNIGALHCDALGEDGYNPGAGDTSCAPHSSDYNPQNWIIELNELLRLIQFFNLLGYYSCPGVGEDGYCPGTPS